MVFSHWRAEQAILQAEVAPIYWDSNGIYDEAAHKRQHPSDDNTEKRYSEILDLDLKLDVGALLA